MAWLLALAVAPLHAAASAPHYTHREWLEPDGLPHNAAERLLMARDGRLWIGTRAGLARFDGLKFTVFDSRAPGFTDDAILDLAEDADGTLWIATKKGLYQKRGEHFRRLAQADGLLHNHVTQVAPAGDGSVWLATQGGVNRLAGSEIAAFPLLETVFDANMHPEEVHDVASLALDAGGGVWAGTKGGLWRVNPEAGALEQAWRPPAPLNTFQQAQRLLADREGRLWFGGEDALYLREGAEWRALPFPKAAGDIRVRQLCQDDSGQIWAARAGRLFQVDGNSITPFPDDYGLSDAYVTDVLPDKGRLWLATRHRGLQCLEPSRLRLFSTRDGLCHNSVVSVAPERGGGLWVATLQGVMRMRSGKFEFPKSSLPLAELATLAVFEDRAGVVWISSPDRLESPLFCLEPTPDGYRKLPVEATVDPRSFFEDRSGKLWVGGIGGLQCMLTNYLAEISEGSPTSGILGVHRHRIRSSRWQLRPGGVAHMAGNYRHEFLGTNWRGSQNDLTQWAPLTQADRAHWENAPFPIDAPWPNFDFRAFQETPDGALWMGTWGGGLVRLLEGRLSVLTTRDGLASDHIHSLLVDGGGLLWAGTARGLSRIEPGGRDPSAPPRAASFTTRHGLPDGEAYQMVEDHLGNLWVGCGAGVYRVSRARLAAVAAGAEPRVETLLLDSGDGLRGGETTSRQQPTACRTPDGLLWFATPTGLAQIDPAAAERPRPPPKMFLERLVSGGREWPLADSPQPTPPAHAASLELPAGSGTSLSIEFTAVDYASPKQLRFRHRLEGQDDSWVDVGSRRVALFTNLRPGRYHFQAQVAGRDGQWIREGAGLAFHIAPFYWQTAWFRLLASLALLLAAGAGVGWRLRVLRRLEKAEASAALVRQRELLARDLHDDLGSRLAQLSFLGEMATRDPSQAPRMAQIARETARDLDCLVWTVDPERGRLDQLISYLAEVAHDFVSSAGIDLDLALPADPPRIRLPDPVRKAILLAAKEALHNAVKHARATRIRLSVECAGEDLRVAIEDDGRGLPLPLLAPGGPGDPAGSGHGVPNMRRRLAEVGGACEFHPRPGGGAIVLLRLPMRTPVA